MFIVAHEMRLNGSDTWHIEPLGQVLARSIAIGGKDLMLLGDAMELAGWTPPEA